jgi:hypothetical protein
MLLEDKTCLVLKHHTRDVGSGRTPYIVTKTTDGREWSVSRNGRFMPRESTRGSRGLSRRVDLSRLGGGGKDKCSYLFWESNPVVQPVVI